MKQNLLNGIVHEVPDDMSEVLSSDGSIIELWNKLTPIQRNEWICWVTHVKKPQTRLAHISRMMDNLSDGKKTPCCWGGCPHR